MSAGGAGAAGGQGPSWLDVSRVCRRTRAIVEKCIACMRVCDVLCLLVMYVMPVAIMPHPLSLVRPHTTRNPTARQPAGHRGAAGVGGRAAGRGGRLLGRGRRAAPAGALPVREPVLFCPGACLLACGLVPHASCRPVVDRSSPPLTQPLHTPDTSTHQPTHRQPRVRQVLHPRLPRHQHGPRLPDGLRGRERHHEDRGVPPRHRLRRGVHAVSRLTGATRVCACVRGAAKGCIRTYIHT